MSRTLASRFAALLLALTFVFGQTGREAHACPIHDAVGHRDVHSLRIISMHGHHGSAAAASSPEHAGHQHGADCSCIGCCHAGGHGILSPSATTLSWLPAFSTFAPGLRRPDVVLPGRPAFQLPLSNGPPGVLRSA